jgi:O-antigen ligase
MPIVYKWVRDTGVGEITKREDGFYRIFFQSHIFVLIGFLILFSLFISKIIQNKYKNRKEIFLNISILSFFLSINILSFSRTNWLGLILGLILFFIIILYKFKFKKLLYSLAYFVAISILSVFILYFVARVPFPNHGSSFSLNSISDRASEVSGEAGVSSRWSLLPVMISQIKLHPILGSGFGTEITYISSDPRVLEDSPSGEYTTFSFEWGWLDLWIKIGFFGTLSYLLLLYFLFSDLLKNFLNNNDFISLGISVSIFSLAVLHFFSPYLNHPLGIGIIMIIIIFVNKKNNFVL